MQSTIDAFASLEGSPWTIPNAVSIASLSLVVDGIFRNGIDSPTGFVEVGAGFVGDLVDGQLARRLGQDTELGAAVDAVLDKIKQTLFVATLVKHKALPVPAALAITGVNMANALATNKFEISNPDQEFIPSTYGKLGAFLTNCALGAYAAGEQDISDKQRNNRRATAHAVAIAGVGLCAVANVGYFKRAN